MPSTSDRATSSAPSAAPEPRTQTPLPLQRALTAVASAMIAVVLAAVVTASPPDARVQSIRDNPATYRSSVLGFAILAPALWTRTIAGSCGSGYLGKSDEELLRMPIRPIAFKAPDDATALYVSIWRVFDETGEQQLRWLTQDQPHELAAFTLLDGRIGQRLRVAHGSRTAVTYIFEPDCRRIQLEFFCATHRLPRLLPLFDNVARCLTISPPQVDEPVPNTTKTLRGHGFTLSYPGEWSWEQPYEHVADDARNEVLLNGPTLSPDRWPQRVTASVYREDLPRQPLAGLLEQMTLVAEQSTRQIRFSWEPFETNAGRRGARCHYEYPAGRARTTVLIYAFDLISGGLLSLNCTCPADRLADFESRFDQMGKALHID